MEGVEVVVISLAAVAVAQVTSYVLICIYCWRNHV